MPEICRFYGIIIQIFYRDHAPPHFHATYGEYKATFTIQEPRLLFGELPRRAEVLVLDWAVIHQEELTREWKLAEEEQPLFKIRPLE